MIWDHYLEQPTLRLKERTDYRTAQAVDDALDMLATGNLHEKVRAFMAMRMVPPAVQRRVLAGHATVNQESVIKNCMAGRGYSVLR